MSFRRGLVAGAMSALVGVLASIAPIAVFCIVSWQLKGSDEFDRQYDIASWRREVFVPLVGVCVYLGLSGFATYSPTHKQYRFTPTLLILFFTAVPLTWFVFAMELTPRRSKGIRHPQLYFSEFVVLLLPPLLVAIFMLVTRQETADREVDTPTL